MTDSSIPDHALAALQQQAERVTADLAALDVERKAALAAIGVRRAALQRELLRIERAAKAYRGETERRK